MSPSLITAALATLGAFIASLLLAANLPDQAEAAKAAAAAAGPFAVAVFSIVVHLTEQTRIKVGGAVATAKAQAAATAAAATPAAPSLAELMSSPEAQAMIHQLMGGGGVPNAPTPAEAATVPSPAMPMVTP